MPDWSQLEPQEADFHWESLDPLVHWAAEAGLGVSIGPLIDLTSGTLPGWLSAWNGDMLSLTAFMSDFIGTIVNRYKSQVRVWQLFSGFNQTDACGLVEDNRVRLAARLLDTAKEVDPDGVWIIGVSQPWGEYLTTAGQNYSPLIFADTLLRAGYKIGGIELEILPESVAGRGSHRRDLLGFVQLIDLFDHLSIPLEITTGDQLSRGEMPGVVTAAVAAPTVQAFYWDGWSAQDQCGRVPGGSIWNGSAADGTLEAFRGFRQSWLR